jgi:hypothetical protein
MSAPEGARFWPLSWSPNGKRLAGIVIGEDATVHGLGLFSLETRSYEVRRLGGRLDWLAPRWLGDSRRLAVRGARGISIIDTATWQEKPLVEVGGYFIGQTLRVSRDERFLTWTETATEGDIWMVTLR